MARSNSGDRGRIAYSILIAVIAGLIFGIGTLFTKIAMTQPGIMQIIMYPVSWIAAACGIAGFLLMQKAMHKEYMSIVLPVITGLSTLISVLLAFGVLNEVLSMTRWIGIVLVIVGTLVIALKR